jgi:hypothetical protein
MENNFISMKDERRTILISRLPIQKNYECGVTQEFAHHLHNVAKKLEEDEKTGSKRYVYVKLAPDHFRHAFNYEAMARSVKPLGMFADTDWS